MNLLKSDKTEYKKKQRYEKLDLIRGITLISMITYHTCWDLVWMYGKPWGWYDAWPGYLWQQSICWTFILLSGFCWSMGKKKWKRGLQVLFSSCLVTIVTILVMPQDPVLFGVLTFMGSAMLLMIPLHRVLPRNPIIGCIIAGGGFFILRNVSSHCLGFERLAFGHIPDSWFSNWFTAWLGFPFPGFRSSDYFAILPWFFLFMAGYYGYLWISQVDKLSIFYYRKPKEDRNPLLRKLIAAVQWSGAHTLILYLLHQVVIYIVLFLVFY